MRYIHSFIPEFFLIGLKAILYAMVSGKLYSFSIFHATAFSDIFNKRIRIGDNVSIGRETYINGNVTIGDFSYISSPCTRINAGVNSSVTIGKFCSISWGVSIISKNEHDINLLSSSWQTYGNTKDIGRNVVILNDVWIGAGSIILPGVTIGNGAVVGAGSVVTKDVAPYSIVVGNPAKHIRYRFPDDICDILNQSRWWDISIDNIKNLNINDIINEK